MAVTISEQTLTLLQHSQFHTGPSLSALHPPPAQFSIALGIYHMISSHLHTEAEQEKNQTFLFKESLKTWPDTTL